MQLLRHPGSPRHRQAYRSPRGRGSLELAAGGKLIALARVRTAEAQTWRTEGSIRISFGQQRRRWRRQQTGSQTRAQFSASLPAGHLSLFAVEAGGTAAGNRRSTACQPNANSLVSRASAHTTSSLIRLRQSLQRGAAAVGNRSRTPATVAASRSSPCACAIAGRQENIATSIQVMRSAQ